MNGRGGPNRQFVSEHCLFDPVSASDIDSRIRFFPVHWSTFRRTGFTMSWNTLFGTGELPPPTMISPQLKFLVRVPSVTLPQIPLPTPFAKRNSMGSDAPQSQAGGAGASFRL